MTLLLLLTRIVRIVRDVANAALGADLFGPFTARLAPHVPIVAMMFGSG